LKYYACVRRDDFTYELPEELIAQTPLTERSASRLLVLDRHSGAVADRTMKDFPGLLEPGDLLVFNDTRVIAARLTGTKPSGGRVEIFLERTLDSRRALVQLRASKPIRVGLRVATDGGEVSVLERRDDLWLVALPDESLDFFERWGSVPLPPYIHREADSADRERYQSIFARESGAVAAPTASLHFDAALAEAVAAKGVGRAFVTLHVGAGTFQPIRTDDLDSHTMHAERAAVSAETWDAIVRTRRAGGRIVAVGTTVVRAIESAALHAARDVTGRDGAAMATDATHAWVDETRLFIRPGFDFKVIDGLLTNFHLPQSTLLMLVCALAGREHVLAAYEHAVRARYRFFSYGDAMFIMPGRPVRR
jgi:S-adenosylmethionine:tRNA ribosyltransferase-isomerase